MEYIAVKEVAKKWGATVHQVQSGCESGRVEGVVCMGYMWLISKNAPKPIDGRTKAARQKKTTDMKRR